MTLRDWLKSLIYGDTLNEYLKNRISELMGEDYLDTEAMYPNHDQMVAVLVLWLANSSHEAFSLDSYEFWLGQLECTPERDMPELRQKAFLAAQHAALRDTLDFLRSPVAYHLLKTHLHERYEMKLFEILFHGAGEYSFYWTSDFADDISEVIYKEDLVKTVDKGWIRRADAIEMGQWYSQEHVRRNLYGGKGLL